MISKVVLAVAIGLLCVNASPMQRAEQEIIELTEAEGEKLEECLEDNGFEDAINGNNGKLDMQKLAKITKKCFQDVPELRALVLTINSVQYLAQKDKNDFCGVQVNSTSDPALKAISQKLERLLTNQNKDFCSLTFDDVLPTLCKLNKYCKKDKQDVDVLFTTFYSIQQLIRKHPSSFSCKNKNGKELLGNVINEKAYTDEFNSKKDKFLSRPLPCGTKFDGAPTQPSKPTGQKSGSFGKQAQTIFMNHRAVKKLL